MRFLPFALCLSILFSTSAFALKSSPSSFRIEDRKNGALILGTDEATIEPGEVFKSVTVLWGNVNIYGKVDDLVLLSGHLTFHKGSEVTKAIVVLGGGFETKDGAKVASEQVVFRAPTLFWRTVRTVVFGVRDNVSSFLKFISILAAYGFLWIVSFLLVLMFPRLETEIALKLFSEGPRNFVMGSIASFLAPVVMVLLILSIVGILMLPLYFLLLGLAGVISYVASALWLGHKLLPGKWKKHGRALALLFGLLVFQFLWWTESFAAISLLLFFWFMGWGSVVRYLRTRS